MFSDLAQRDRRLQGAKRILPSVVAGYLYEALLLFGFCAIGLVDYTNRLYLPRRSPLVYGTAISWALHSGQTRQFDDPSLFVSQQLYGIITATGLAIAAPQIAFQAFVKLFVICAYGFTAPQRSTSISHGPLPLWRASP